MKSKALVFLSTVVMALGLMAQTATQATPAPSGNNGKACACCNHDQAGAKTMCCGKSGACSKDGACCQGKDGKQCPDDVERQRRQDNLLRRRQVPHDVEGKSRQLLQRQNVPASASRRITAFVIILPLEVSNVQCPGSRRGIFLRKVWQPCQLCPDISFSAGQGDNFADQNVRHAVVEVLDVG